MVVTGDGLGSTCVVPKVRRRDREMVVMLTHPQHRRAAERLQVKLRSAACEAGRPGRAPCFIPTRRGAARIVDGRRPSTTSVSFNGLLGAAYRNLALLWLFVVVDFCQLVVFFRRYCVVAVREKDVHSFLDKLNGVINAAAQLVK